MNRCRMGLLVVVILAACASPPAPVVDRSEDPGTQPRLMRLQPDGSYQVRRGDTLYTIAFRFGVDHRDLARWNGIVSPYTIFPDQLLRMSPPPQPVVVTRPIEPRPAPVQRPAPAEPETDRTAKQVPQPVKPPTKAPVNPVSSQVTPEWEWPVSGKLVRGFVPNDPARNGLDIGGEVGQPVLAAATGTVVYSGNGLIGYGELIIIKHNERLLSAYGHNRRRLVDEGETVSRGQKIAELGRNDRNEAVLHFEIRTEGRPVDPRQFLPRP